MTILSHLPGLLEFRKLLKMRTFSNTDGLINCLLQPGLFYHRIQKSMGEEFISLIKPCATRTNPAADDKVNRVASRRTGALFFARHLDCFIMTRDIASIYRDLVPFRKIIVTQDLRPSTRTGKKRGTATQTPTN